MTDDEKISEAQKRIALNVAAEIPADIPFVLFIGDPAQQRFTMLSNYTVKELVAEFTEKALSAAMATDCPIVQVEFRRRTDA